MMKFAKTNKKSFQQGFTLVEMLVYLAIFVVMATASIAFLISLHKLVGQYEVETALYRSGSNVMEQIILAARQADEVDMVGTVEDDPDNGVLVVENGASTTAFTLNSGALELTMDGVNLGDMTVDAVTVDSFTVYHYAQAESEFVRIRLVLTATVRGTTKSATFYGGSIIRGS